MSNILPALLLPLLGREKESATIIELLNRDDVRLVTITGPGGVGKTCMSLHVGHQSVKAFKDGVFFISLAPISDSTLIIPTIARELGIIESPNRLLLDNLKDFLHKKKILLLLDNFEQIVSAAPLMTELLNACAELRMLVTSREALHLRGEHEFPLTPLELDDQSANTVMGSPAIELFIQRVKAVQPDFQLTEENASAITEICTRLDGLPLALELAAARIKLLPPKAMLKKLQESSLQLLTRGARDLPARQQTLHNAIQWSYDLLDDEEKQAFRWFSVFVGGSTLEAAQAMIGESISLDVIDSLVGKSLLRQTEMEGAPRLAMLETIREFGLEQLKKEAELEKVRRTHASWYTSFAEEAELHLLGAEQKAWLQKLELEKDNLRAALRWAIDTGDEELTLRLAGSLGQFWFASGRWSEGRRSLEETLAQRGNTKPDLALQAKALFQAGSLARYQADFARARGLCEQSLTLYRALGDKQGVVVALAELSRISNYQQDQTAKKDFLAEAASRIESLPDTVEKALAYKEMHFSILQSTDPISDEAIHYLDEWERILRVLNFRTGLVLAVVQRASSAIMQSNYALATSLADEAMSLADEFQDERLKVRVEQLLVYLDLQRGDYAAARQRLAGAIESTYRRNDNLLSMTMLILAAVLLEQNMVEWSAKVLGLADVSLNIKQRHPHLTMFERFPLTQGYQAKLRAQLGEESFQIYLTAGKQLTLDDLLAIPQPATQTQTSPDSLTSRELEVLHLLVDELSNPQIAERLVVSRRTVDAHLRSIYNKLGVKSRDAALRVARENRLI
ncbi:MAG: hypothetical protein C3F07_02395 [Anaerolineales bacterium]|nr:MAG: hypothetical protein C3F07_02395 [Anaerolineales bacterium]